MHGNLYKNGPIFRYQEPRSHFLAWELIWEINTELCITTIVQFSVPFLHKSGNTPVCYKDNH